MKVLYDHQVFTWQNFGGISRYYYELIKAQRSEAELTLLYSDNEYVVADPEMAARVSRKYRPRHYSKLQRLFVPKSIRRRKTVEAVNQAHSINRLTAGEYDLFHPTYYDRYFLEHVGPRPFVVTVYDMIHEKYPEFFHLGDPASPQKRELIHRAAHVIAISESTKRDLIELCGIEESRVSVTYLGSSLQGVGPASEFALPERYLLMVGSRGTYKNCYFALRALQEIVLGQSNLHVVFAGGGSFSKEEAKFFASLGLAERVHYYPAADPDLRTLYSRAEAFVFPSLYEGFGIPLLEAFSCGCPVLSSETAALKEVAGDAALYFEPKNVRSIQNAASRILDDRTLREQLRRKGTERLEQYSWEDCAAKTAAIYKKILGGVR